MKLTKKQEQFCREYLIDMNATQSYKRAGYSAKSDKVAGVEGHKLLKNPKIKRRIDQLIKEREKKTGVTAEMVIDELAKIAFADIGQIYTESGQLKEIVDIDDRTRAAIASVTSKLEASGSGKTKKVFEVRTVKMSDKKHALEMLGKHLGIFRDKVDVKIDYDPVQIVLPDNGR